MSDERAHCKVCGEPNAQRGICSFACALKAAEIAVPVPRVFIQVDDRRGLYLPIEDPDK